MKKYLILFIFFLSSFSGSWQLYAEKSFTNDDARAILLQIQESVNKGDADSIVKLLSPSSLLAQSIKDAIVGKQIQFVQEFSGLETLQDGKYKITAHYAAKGMNWNVQGLSNYYIIDMSSGTPVITDTDFFKFMPDIFNGIIGSGILSFLPILIFGLVIFWFWMLSDLSKREILENKWMWYCLLFFVPFGSIIYFFTGRKKYVFLEKYRTIKH